MAHETKACVRRSAVRKPSPVMLREEKTAYMFLTPSIIGTLVFVMIPIVVSLLLGFVNWNPMKSISDISFSGLENFKKILHDERVLTAILNNLKYTVFYVPITIALALLLAALLNKLVFGKVPLRMMVFMPYICQWFRRRGLMILFYPNATGPINSILTNIFHIANPPKWFTSSNTPCSASSRCPSGTIWGIIPSLFGEHAEPERGGL